MASRSGAMVIRGLMVLAVAAGVWFPAGATGAQPAIEDGVEYAVQLIYAVPRNGNDRGLDQNGVILGSVESAQRWLEEETEGRRVNLVTDRRGNPVIEFLELTRTEEEIRTLADRSSSYQIEYEARAAGFNRPGIINAIYYEGAADDDTTCGAAPSPEYTPSNSFTLFLESACDFFSFVGADEDADFWELTLLHELFHALGAVERCAPNDDGEGHVDEPNDLMFGKAEPWVYPVRLDVGRDDYYGHGRNACYDTARSPYLVPHGPIVELYPTAFVDLAIDGCRTRADSVPSEHADAEVWVVNLREEPVEIEWLGSNGRTESLGTIDAWGGVVYTGAPGDTLQILDASGDCLGGFVMPDSLEIGVIWILP